MNSILKYLFFTLFSFFTQAQKPFRIKIQFPKNINIEKQQTEVFKDENSKLKDNYEKLQKAYHELVDKYTRLKDKYDKTKTNTAR